MKRTKIKAINHLPVPCLLWVPFYILGIILAKFQVFSYPILFFLLFTAILLFSFKKSRIASLAIISLIFGYFILLNAQKIPYNHISKLFETEKPNSLYISKNKQWEALAFSNNYGRLPHIQQKTIGRVVSQDKKTNNSYHYLIELISIANYPVNGKISLFTENNLLKYGDIIESVLKISEYKIHNPGQTDYSKLLKQSGVYASATAISEIKIIDNHTNFISKTVFYLRNKIYNKLTNNLRYSAPLALSLVLGDRLFLTYYDENFYSEILPASGLMHLFAVSGLHVGVISLLFLVFLKFLRLPIFFVRSGTVILLILFAFLCNGSPPVVRAVFFFSILILAKMTYRMVSEWQIILLSLFIITLYNPLLIFSASLQFSFLAISAIFLARQLLLKFKYYRLNRFSKAIINYLVIFFTIQLMIIPLQIYYFNYFNFNVLMANLFGIPLITLILPLFFVIIICPLNFLFFNQFVLSADFLTDLFNRSVTFFSRFPFNINYSQTQLEIFTMIMFIVLGLFLLAYGKNKKRNLQGILLIIMAFIFLLPLKNTKDFQIIFFDTGNSDSFLLRFSENDYMLIDTGEIRNKSKSINRNLLPYLKKENVSRLSKVLITHAHSDHYGGIFKLAEQIKIDTLIITDKFLQTDIGKEITQHRSFKNTNFWVINDTLSYHNNDYKIHFLHPDKNYFHENENNNSIVCKIILDEMELLFTGDIEYHAENYLISNYGEFLKADILKAGHHGSKTSSHQNFMKLVMPELFLISASGNERRGFPNKQVLQTAGQISEKIYVTGKDGAVIINKR